MGGIGLVPRSGAIPALPGGRTRFKPVALLVVLAILAVPSAARAEAGDYLSFAKSSSMTQNTTNAMSGTPSPEPCST